MLFPQTFPMFYSLGLMVVASSSIFFWRFYIFRKKLIKEFKSIPSIIVLGMKGSGKTSFINMITNSQVTLHPIQNMNFASVSLGGQKLQFIEIPYLVEGAADQFKKIKEINLAGGIYVFDVSKSSQPIEVQLENFKRAKEFFKDLKFILVANKIDDVDLEKMKKLETEFGKIYKFSSINKTISKQDSVLLKKELEDISTLISSLLREIKLKEEIKPA